MNANKGSVLFASIRVHSRPGSYNRNTMRFKILIAAVLMSAAFAADIPRKAPELGVKLPDGKQALVSSYRGKVLCMAFILTT
jgi:hypothetical protein